MLLLNKALLILLDENGGQKFRLGLRVWKDLEMGLRTRLGSGIWAGLEKGLRI